MEKSIISFLQKKATSNKTKTSFPGFRDVPFDRTIIESMDDEELHRMLKLYNYYFTNEIYVSVGGLVRPSKFELADYQSGKRSEIIRKRMEESKLAAARMILWCENTLLIEDVMRERFPGIADNFYSEE